MITANGVKLINKAVYIQDQFNITDQLKLTAGVRHDKNSGFGNHTTPSVNQVITLIMIKPMFM